VIYGTPPEELEAAYPPTGSVTYEALPSQVAYPPTAPVVDSSDAPIYEPVPMNPAPVESEIFEIAGWTEGTSSQPFTSTSCPALASTHTIDAEPGLPMALPHHSSGQQDNSLYTVSAGMAHNPGMAVQSLWNLLNPYDAFGVQSYAHGMDLFTHFPDVGLHAALQSSRSAPPEVGLAGTSSW
jgi:hypothetical protein